MINGQNLSLNLSIGMKGLQYFFIDGFGIWILENLHINKFIEAVVWGV
jgi:hypothetical protein